MCDWKGFSCSLVLQVKLLPAWELGDDGMGWGVTALDATSISGKSDGAACPL